MRRIIKRQRESLISTAARLESLSPLQVLTRGYSVTQTTSGEIVRRSSLVAIGDSIITRLQHGELVSKVESVQEPKE